eukprot:TRINITY_DN111431_c0_g1_i1.p1 TRINITY_DN111431_c0_g1~~TRINITY_DN111431_c0_g1_i1.p1  ORF type:complete len:470 (-),score=150.72 TRINITY_DN111431_c0_g1_i1:460-1833(-)
MAMIDGSPDHHHFSEHALAVCCADISNILNRYARSVETLLEESIVENSRFVEDQDELAVNPKEVHALAAQWRRDGKRVKDVLEGYRADLAGEQDRWVRARESLADSQQVVHQQEIEAVIQRYRQQAALLEETILSRSEQHFEALGKGFESCSKEASGHLLERARSDWTDDVCKAVTLDMRQEWRKDQKTVLQLLAKELRAERQNAMAALERHASTAEQVGEAVRKSWAREVTKAKDELEQLAQSYKNALKTALESKLRETRRHAAEQAEFFQREIQEALKVEQQEEQMHSAQLRKMRLAILKWRFDYMKEAKLKAREVTQRRQQVARKRLEIERATLDNESDAASANKKGGSVTSLSAPNMPSTRHRKNNETMETLANAQKVLNMIWQRLPGDEDNARNFLSKVEKAIPMTPETLTLYEEYLEEHGILPALRADEFSADGNAQNDDEGGLDLGDLQD